MIFASFFGIIITGDDRYRNEDRTLTTARPQAMRYMQKTNATKKAAQEAADFAYFVMGGANPSFARVGISA